MANGKREARVNAVAVVVAPDRDVAPGNQRTRHHLVLANTERYVTLARSLRDQLGEAG